VSSHTDTDRIHVEPTSTHVRVWLDGEVIADSIRPLALHESGLPVRWYLPRDDVRTDLLQESDTQTFCPWKGAATHWSAPSVADVAWSYEDAYAPVRAIEGHIAFYPDRVRVEVDR
jgi:uncharacterized protein (DUF427 family)